MNNQSFSRPVSAKDIQRQIQDGIAEMQCSFCEGCEFFNSCEIGTALYHEELESQARADFYNFGPADDPFDFGPEESFFDFFDLEDFNQEMEDIELSMIKSIIMLNPENSSLNYEDLERMAREEYRLCRDN